MSVTIHQLEWHHIPENLKLQKHFCDNGILDTDFLRYISFRHRTTANNLVVPVFKLLHFVRNADLLGTYLEMYEEFSFNYIGSISNTICKELI